MKKTILFLALVMSMVACQSDGTSGKAAAAVDVPSGKDAQAPANNASTTAKQAADVPHVSASILSPMIGLWHYRTVVGVKDAKTKDDYLGRWIDLKGDQTFTSGLWQDQTNAGKWTFDGESSLINFYYEKPEAIYDEFKVQGAGMDIVIFKGNTSRTKRGIQIKMVKENDRPAQ